MKLLADENIARAIVDRLRQDGYDIQHIAEIASGSNDGDVLSLADREEAILLTDDKDFRELVVLQRKATHGVILIRLEGLPIPVRADIVSEVVKTRATELPNAFTAISRQSVRIHQMRTQPQPDDPSH